MLEHLISAKKGSTMPVGGVEHDKYGRLARVKLRSSKDSKDSDTRSVLSSTSTTSRKHRDSSTSSSRTNLPIELQGQSTVQGGPSSTSLDQLPRLPESDGSSPSSLSSPLSRTNSAFTDSTALTSPSSSFTPAFLKPFLESDSDSPSPTEDSQPTPKPEKTQILPETKENSPKALVLTDDDASSQHSSCDTVIARPKRSSSRVDPSPSAPELQHDDHQSIDDDTHHEQLSLVNRSHTPASVQVYSTSHEPPDQQALYGQHHLHAQHPPPKARSFGDPRSARPRPQSMMYYGEYGPPPPAPMPPQPPQQLNYHPSSQNATRDENAMVLLDQVQRALPDIHALMVSYRELYGELETRENQIYCMQEERSVEIRKSDARYTRLKKEISDLESRHAIEEGDLRLEISNLDRKCKELHIKVTTEEKNRARLSAGNDNLREQQRQAVEMHNDELNTLRRDFGLEKDKLIADQRASHRSVHEQLQSQLRKAEAHHAQQISGMDRAHEEEKRVLEGRLAEIHAELQDHYAKTSRNFQSTLDAKQKTLDEERRSHLYSRDSWDKERESMTRRWEEERTILQRTVEEQRKATAIRHQREKDDLMEQASQAPQNVEKNDTIISLQREIEVLRSGWDADRFKLLRVTTEFKTTARALNDQHSKMQKLSEVFGDAVDTKGHAESKRADSRRND